MENSFVTAFFFQAEHPSNLETVGPDPDPTLIEINIRFAKY